MRRYRRNQRTRTIGAFRSIIVLAIFGVTTQFSWVAGAEEQRAERGIENPVALKGLFERFQAAEAHQAGPPTRISFYTDSINGWDGVTSYLRHHLQERFGDGGRGWIHVAKGWTYQHQRDVRWNHSSDWRVHILNRGRGPENRYGFGGVMAADGSRRSSATFETTRDHPVGGSLSRFRLFYQAFPSAGSVRITVDDDEPQLLQTSAPQVEDRVHEIQVADGSHSFRVAVADRNIRLYGVVMERDGPGVVVDSVALIGARVARLLRFDQAHWRRQIELRQPDLLVFWLGANNATSQGWTRDAFVRDYGSAIANARSGRPEASCLVVSISDIGDRETGTTLRRVPVVVETQREVAAAQGCAFYDLYNSMGGAGTMRRWVSGNPRLATPDHRHLTPAGGSRIGQMIHDALMEAYEASQ